MNRPPAAVACFASLRSGRWRPFRRRAAAVAEGRFFSSGPTVLLSLAAFGSDSFRAASTRFSVANPTALRRFFFPEGAPSDFRPDLVSGPAGRWRRRGQAEALAWRRRGQGAGGGAG
jgi:hypothetical protein